MLCNITYQSRKSKWFIQDGRGPLEGGVPEECAYDLSIIKTKDLKCSKQCLSAAKAANKILRMIERIFTYKCEEIMVQ